MARFCEKPANEDLKFSSVGSKEAQIGLGPLLLKSIWVYQQFSLINNSKRGLILLKIVQYPGFIRRNGQYHCQDKTADSGQFLQNSPVKPNGGGAHFGAFCPKSKPKGVGPMALILNKIPQNSPSVKPAWNY